MERDRPWFLWDVNVTEAEFRLRLRHPDLETRAQWQGALLREARVFEVWKYLTLEDLLENWSHIRRRALWEWAVEGWTRDGLVSS